MIYPTTAQGTAYVRPLHYVVPHAKGLEAGKQAAIDAIIHLLARGK